MDERELRDLARQHTEGAIDTLGEVATDGKAPSATRRAAARGLLRFDLTAFMDESKIDAIRRVANGKG